jgi:S-adenosylmethionine-diacylglycerol 3-amino-3-carboxypropyl transferase
MSTEVAAHAEFGAIRYAQCWEDADILVSALQPAGRVCVSIASAGDNAFALLAAGASRVVALDLNPAQLACVALRAAAYRHLEHPEFLRLLGSRPSASSDDRAALYARCRPALAPEVAAFWDARPALIAAGIGSAGKFENYFRLFRSRVLPLVHGRARVSELLDTPRDLAARRAFYARRWDTWRWRLLFRVFFSRRLMGAIGRDPAFFHYVEGSVADRILARTRHALAELDPTTNPYLHWILRGTHGQALPYALREENFARICANLHRLEWHLCTVEDWLARPDAPPADTFNLSDIFEYMSADNTERILRAILARATPGARLAYWNMLVPRSRTDSLASRLHPLPELAAELHAQDKAWFYSRFVVEEVSGSAP